MSAGEAAGALRAGCCQSCREHSSVPEALPCERGMTEFPCLTGGRRPAAAGRAEKTPPGSSAWDRAEQSRQGEPWPPPAAATRSPRLGATAALGTGNPVGKQGVGGGKDAGSGHRRAAAEPSPAGRQERLLGAGKERCLCRESAPGLGQSSSGGKPTRCRICGEGFGCRVCLSQVFPQKTGAEGVLGAGVEARSPVMVLWWLRI